MSLTNSPSLSSINSPAVLTKFSKRRSTNVPRYNTIQLKQLEMSQEDMDYQDKIEKLKIHLRHSKIQREFEMD